MDANGRLLPYLQRIAGFKGRVLEIPDALHRAGLALADAERAHATAKKQLSNAHEAVKDSELEIAAEVAGLKEFPNETARKTAAAARMKASPAHQALLRLVAAAEGAVFEAAHTAKLVALDVKRLEDEQRALQTYADVIASETMLLTAGR